MTDENENVEEGRPWVDVDLAANRRYAESEGVEGTAASWINVDLSLRDLTRAVLVEATLIDSDFSRASLNEADLFRSFAGGARFPDASLRAANFGKATLVGADFGGADASGANFAKADLSDANLSSANLSAASLVGVRACRACFRGALLRGADLTNAVLDGADFTGADLSEARFERTIVDGGKFQGAVGLDRAELVSLNVNGRILAGPEASAWFRAVNGAVPIPVVNRWATREFQLFLLSKMSGTLVANALVALASTDEEMSRVAAELGTVFDSPGHPAAEYRRVLGAPISSTPVTAPPSFVGSCREEYVLPLWPDLVFVVNEDRNGSAWGWEFEGGPAELPADLRDVAPGHWSSERLRRLAADTEIVEEWTYDLEANLTFNDAEGPARFNARFDLGLLQRWTAVRDG